MDRFAMVISTSADNSFRPFFLLAIITSRFTMIPIIDAFLLLNFRSAGAIYIVAYHTLYHFVTDFLDC